MHERRRLSAKELRERTRNAVCPLCHQLRKFLWGCPCGCLICEACMQRDLWGFTCNNVTWTCPDCGEERSF
jgi:hypothetical protein